MKNIPYLLLCLLALLHPNCRKDQDQDCPPDLPCATQAGENTFGCYINGKPWVAGVAPYIWDPTVHKIEASHDEPNYSTEHNNFLQITASSVDSFAYDFISMTFTPVTGIGNIKHNVFTTFRTESHLASGVYRIDTIAPYEIVLTKLDYKNRVVSGYFSFTALTKSKKDTIRVTDGRFDIKYDPY